MNVEYQHWFNKPSPKLKPYKGSFRKLSSEIEYWPSVKPFVFGFRKQDDWGECKWTARDLC